MGDSWGSGRGYGDPKGRSQGLQSRWRIEERGKAPSLAPGSARQKAQPGLDGSRIRGWREEGSACIKDSWVLGPVSRGVWQEMMKVQGWTSEEATAGGSGEQMGLLQRRERQAGQPKHHAHYMPSERIKKRGGDYVKTGR